MTGEPISEDEITAFIAEIDTAVHVDWDLFDRDVRTMVTLMLNAERSSALMTHVRVFDHENPSKLYVTAVIEESLHLWSTYILRSAPLTHIPAYARHLTGFVMVARALGLSDPNTPENAVQGGSNDGPEAVENGTPT